MSILSRLHDAWRILRCRGHVVLFQRCLSGVAHDPAGCAHTEPSALRTLRVLKCSAGKTKCVGCPRFQAFGQIPQEVEGKVFFFPGDRNADRINSERELAEIYDRYAETTPARIIEPPTHGDFETHAVLPNSMHCVDYTQRGSEQGDPKSQTIGPVHAPQPTTPGPEENPK